MYNSQWTGSAAMGISLPLYAIPHCLPIPCLARCIFDSQGDLVGREFGLWDMDLGRTLAQWYAVESLVLLGRETTVTFCILCLDVAH